MIWQTAAIAAGLLVPATNAQDTDILSLVNALIGTTNGGHVFAGATLPFGMAKAGADVNVENQGGFSTEPVAPGNITTLTGNITGFSHMHDSGTGGVSPAFSSHSPPMRPSRMMTTHFLETN